MLPEIQQHQQEWLQNLKRMDTNRICNQAPKKRRNIDAQGKDWSTNFILRIKERSLRLTFIVRDDDDDEYVTLVPHKDNEKK